MKTLASTGVRGTRKQRFRLRRKLQSALLRLVAVVSELGVQGLSANAENIATSAAAVTVLGRLLDRSLGVSVADPLMVNAKGKTAIEMAMVRRVRETAKRRGRRGYRNRGPIVRPPTDAPGNRPDSTNQTTPVEAVTG